MSGLIMRRLIGAIATLVVCVLGSASTAYTQLEIGNWVRTDMPGMSMTITACCNGGRRLTYHIADPQGKPAEMVVDSGLDGKDAPMLVGGKPSGQTMAITRVDALHASSVQKMNGKVMSTSKSTLSADGKTLTNEDEIVEPGGKKGMIKEVWVKK